MFHALRKHMTYANAAATLALMFAMSGSALAASHYLITSTKQISPKVLKSLKGKSGSTGATGESGPAGPPGPQGPGGPQGAPGSNGTNGSNGESVTVSEVKTGETVCAKLGGAKFAAGGKEAFACNGKEGASASGKATLASGASETGVWGLLGNATEAGEKQMTAISFPVPLAGPLSGEHCAVEVNGQTVAENPCQLHYIGENEGEGEAGENLPEVNGKKVCTGNVEEPHAAKGNLCVFVKESSNIEPFVPNFPGIGAVNFFAPQILSNNAIDAAGPAGTMLTKKATSEGPFEAIGSWVVTAE